jgi:hypothetical protein
MRRWRSWVVVLGFVLACGGKAVVDGDAGAGGGAAGGGAAGGGGTAPEGCPSGLVGEETPCSEVGLECPGEGDDPFCGGWTCACADNGTFDCVPMFCQ